MGSRVSLLFNTHRSLSKETPSFYDDSLRDIVTWVSGYLLNMIDNNEEMNRWFDEIRVVVEFFYIFQEEKVPGLLSDREI